MANLLKDKILIENKNLLIFDTKASLTTKVSVPSVYCVYYVKVDESNGSKATSYVASKDGSKLEILSDVATDLVFCDDFNTIISTTKSVDTLYLEKVNRCVYEYTGTDLLFFVQALDEKTGSLVNRRVKYTSSSITPHNLSLNKIYTIKLNKYLYVIDDNKEIFPLKLYQIINYFSLNDGQLWSDIFGTYVDPTVLEPLDKFQQYMRFATYDADGDGKVDTTENAQLLNGKSGAYYLNYENFIGIPTNLGGIENQEVVNARGGKSTLKARLDELDVKLLNVDEVKDVIETPTFTNGKLTSIERDNGTSVILSYKNTGSIDRIIERGNGGKTVTSTFNYDSNNVLTSITKTVV